MQQNLRREAALRLLAETGISRSNYEPPLVRLLWRLGVKIPPPHFAPFAPCSLVAGGSFALAWGVAMWFLVWWPQGASASSSLISALGTGAVFGLGMACYYAYGRRKYKLPHWHSLGSLSAGA